jgi:hypothetical protein
VLVRNQAVLVYRKGVSLEKRFVKIKRRRRMGCGVRDNGANLVLSKKLFCGRVGDKVTV